MRRPARLQACFILFGGVAGGIFFQEFKDVDKGKLGSANWIFYIAGFLSVLLGLYLVAPPQDNGGSAGEPKSTKLFATKTLPSSRMQTHPVPPAGKPTTLVSSSTTQS